ncbi:DNA-binding response OmpR family regulator [Microbacterium phyllosphaerae]|uniref:DNA-binding response OmpR family regulator n=1 Tax=Microbacterium phyllosphaerae TaxID=124798 RepID=A0ABS4WPE3_9MICO|nr:response regulator [Microbacterium phyllosphaerae]MBP2377921.1 DNA-binding response OmpR family regulator [Microbacterium phyllosphaerae]MCS3442088.1 DNA-binding response OmpR family regulator [Microbacterium phyllosphaerae]
MSGRPLALVVEDSADQMDLLQRYLDREGFDVFAAIDAESAIAAFPTISPSVAVVDLLLPGITGEECARLVQARFPDCFLIVSSVLDVADYPDADAALPKPIVGADLRRLLRGVAR